MDLSIPGSTTNLPLTPVFGDNVQDLLGTGTLNVNPSAIITVNSIADTVDDPSSGVTTLRDAINQANADNGQDLIVFDRSLFSNAQTITLSGTELDITHNLDIIAPRDSLTGADLVTVSGNKASRVFEVESGATVSLDGLIVADGNYSATGIDNDGGGGIKNSGTLTLNNSIVSDNSVTSFTSKTSTTAFSYDIDGNGGGIYNGANLTVTNSTISGNSAEQNGGGIYNGDSITVNKGTIFLLDTLLDTKPNFIIVNNSTISGNSAQDDGGGISNGISNYNSITINNSTISGNLAQGGGGIYNSGSSTVNNSTISGNSAGSENGGGIWDNAGSSTVNNSTISGNSASRGGGISSGSSTVNNSTISGNSASINGGGIFNIGRSTVNNSTISGNSASTNGGGIYNSGGIYNVASSTVNNSTISGNSALFGGGVFNSSSIFEGDTAGVPPKGLPSSFASMGNTIIAGNKLSTNGVNPDVSGTFKSNGYNLIGDSTGSTGFGTTGDIVGTLRNPIDPLLAPLAFNGGSTQTVALQTGSPAIGAGDPTVLDTDPTTDQRGLPRRAADGSTDIGAFEFSS